MNFGHFSVAVANLNDDDDDTSTFGFCLTGLFSGDYSGLDWVSHRYFTEESLRIAGLRAFCQTDGDDDVDDDFIVLILCSF